MLAKTWKTILLAICIIAVLFNIISKVVRTPSFQKNLDAVIEENSVSIDSSMLSNSIENAGQSIKDTASEITNAIIDYSTNTTASYFGTNENTNTVNEVQEEEYSEEEFVDDNQNVETEEVTNTNSKFKVSFN